MQLDNFPTWNSKLKIKETNIPPFPLKTLYDFRMCGRLTPYLYNLQYLPASCVSPFSPIIIIYAAAHYG